MTVTTNGIVANGGCLGGRGECWATAILGQQTTTLMIPSIGRNGGHGGAVVVCGVDLWSVYRIPRLYYTCLCPNSVLVCWDKVLQRLQC